MSRGTDTEDDSENFEFVALRPGQIVGRYKIAAVLGQGGFGITYRAADSDLGREVAIKEYLPAALAVRQEGTAVVPRSKRAAADFVWGRDRFIEEGRTLAALHRVPGIVLVHDFLEANGTAYLVMELLAGQTLQARVESQGPLDAQAIDKIVWVLLDGLERIHSAGFLHRDIKPANILLDEEGRPTLIDFGASRAAVAGRSQAMTAVFTPGYAPVEQFTSAPQGAWTDIYGLAATLHHAVTGKAPPNAIDRMLSETYVPLAASDHSSYPPQLLAGINAGLEITAAERPQSISAWRHALSTPPVGTDAPTVLMRRKPTGGVSDVETRVIRSHRPVTRVLVAGIIGVLVLAGGWLAFNSRTLDVSGLGAVTTSAPALPSLNPNLDELNQAVQDKKLAVEEATRLRREAEVRQKADEETALRRKIEEELRQKAESEELTRRQTVAEAQRKADEAVAERQRIEQEAKRAADAEAAARLKAEEADRNGALVIEEGLRLSPRDRQHIQVALTSLGFSTGGSDGVFGPRSREMIAGWQRKSARAATGYLTADTRTALLREAGPAITRFHEDQKKNEIPATASSSDVAPAAVAQEAAPSAKSVGSCEGTWRSQWCKGAFKGFPSSCWSSIMTVRNGEISDGWPHRPDQTQRNVVSGRVNSDGTVAITYAGIGQQVSTNQHFISSMSGKVADGSLIAASHAGPNGREFTIRVQCH
jgi:serine/threonine protein kinase